MIPLLKPGEPITEARLNQIINGVNAAQITSSDFPLERTSAGTKLKMPRREQDFYARIIETPSRKRDSGDAVKHGEYEWREVYLPGVVGGVYPPEEFENYPEGGGLASVYDADNDKLLEPAYELSNDRTVTEGTLVRMRVYPGVHDHVNNRGFIRRYIFTQALPPSPLLMAEAMADWEENGTYPEGNPRIRCMQLIADPDTEPTPTEPHPKVGTGEPIWIELPRERDGGSGDMGEAHGADPALYGGDRLHYLADDQDRFICQTPYLHMGKIGEIRMLGKPPSAHADEEIPVGWWECNGAEKTGNAGTFELANFARDYVALGGSTDKWGAMPIHHSSDFQVGDENWIYVFDALGVTAFARLPFAIAQWFDTDLIAAHRHTIKAEQGEYPLQTVLFYQRYK